MPLTSDVVVQFEPLDTAQNLWPRQPKYAKTNKMVGEKILDSETEKKKMPLARHVFFAAAALSILFPIAYLLLIGEMGKSSICADLADETTWTAKMIKMRFQVEDLDC